MVTFGWLAPRVGRVADGDLVDLGPGARALARRRRARCRLGALHEGGVDHVGRRPRGDQLVGALELVVDDLLELLVRLRALHVAPVDVEVRRPLHADLLTGGQVGVDLRLAGVRVERQLELVHVEPDLLRVLVEIGPLQVLLVGEHLVVHLPELPLRLGGDRRLGGQRRVGVERQGVVAEVDPHLAVVVLHDLVDGRHDAAAERALEVGELDDGHLGVQRAPHGAVERNAEPVDAVARALCRRKPGRRRRRGVLVARRQAPEAVASAQHHQPQYYSQCLVVHDQLQIGITRTPRDEKPNACGGAARPTRASNRGPRAVDQARGGRSGGANARVGIVQVETSVRLRAATGASPGSA